MSAPALLHESNPLPPAVNPSDDRADYSYLEHAEQPAPQVYGGAPIENGPYYGAEGLAGEPGFEGVNVLPRLTKEDGFVLDAAGKPHFVSMAEAPAVSATHAVHSAHEAPRTSERFDEPTGDFRAADRVAADANRERLLEAGVAHPDAATAMVRMAIDGGYKGTVYQHIEPGSHRVPTGPGRHRR